MLVFIFIFLYQPWIHGVCHWPEEDQWRYFYNSSRLNELVRVVVEWLATHKATTSQREATSTTAKGSSPTHEKGKRKVFDSVEVEKSCKLKEDPPVLRESLEIETKR